MTAHTAIGDSTQVHNIGLTIHCAEATKNLSIYHDSYNYSSSQTAGLLNWQDQELYSLTAYILRETKSTVSHSPTSNL